MLRRTGDPLPPGRRLPRGVRRELSRRRADLTAHARRNRAAGETVTVVQLGDLAPPMEGAAALRGRTQVVGVADLARCRDVHAALAILVAAREALGAGGRLDLVEPYRRTGLVWGMVAAMSPLWRRLFGLRLDLPLPALVRQAGFTIASVERFTMPTVFPPLRPFCSIVGLVPAGRTEPPGALPEGGPAKPHVEVQR